MVALPKETTQNHDILAREYIQSLLQGVMPERPDDFGKWDRQVLNLERAFAKVQESGKNSKNIGEAVAGVLESLCKHDTALRELMKAHIEIAQDESACPELPEAVRPDAVLAAQACPWLDDWIAFSAKWSPRGYPGYYEATGYALLSTVAGRRVAFPYGEMQYTSLFISLIGFTTLFKKTTTARLYYGLLRASGLDWILGANITTPQKMLSAMTGKNIPTNYAKLDPFEKERVRKRLAMAAQRGWYYDEFGQHLDQMVKDNGPMSDFKGLLRLLDDALPAYEYDTHSRGLERIEKPYLSLLASCTPADIKPHAQRDNKFWRDGLFARFCFVVPPRDAKSSRKDFPAEQIEYPAGLVHPLQGWHDRLGEPEIKIVEEMNKAGTEITGYLIEQYSDLPEHICAMSFDVRRALKAYENALLDCIEDKKIHESLYGSYGRLHVLALRCAMLLASFDNGGRIELRHWMRAQMFAEARRRDLHELYAQVNGADESDVSRMERAIKTFLEEWQSPCTASAIKQRCPSVDVRHLSSKQITEICESMAKAGTLRKDHPGQGQNAPRFSIQQN